MMSRNFDLQEVGDINWIKDNYDFDSIAKSIDELIILNVSKNNQDLIKFSNEIKNISKLFSTNFLWRRYKED